MLHAVAAQQLTFVCQYADTELAFLHNPSPVFLLVRIGDNELHVSFVCKHILSHACKVMMLLMTGCSFVALMGRQCVP